MSQQTANKKHARKETGALTNRPIEIALHSKNEWLGFIGNQFREWALGFISEDRRHCAAVLCASGHPEAAKILLAIRN